MARLLGPDAGSRLAYTLVGTLVRGVPGETAVVYADPAGTTLADLAVYNGTGTPGGPIPNSTLTVDQYSQLPQFWFPDGADTVYARVNGGPVWPVNADYDARLDRTAPLYNVTAYGATGDSTTDDTGAIQAAIDAASTAGGGTVYFPPGTYKLATPLTPKNNVRLIGDHYSRSKLNATGSALTWTTSVSGIEVAHLAITGGTGHTIDGTNYASRWHIHHCDLTVTATNKSIIHMVDADWIGNLVEDCDMHRPAAATVPGVYLTTASGGTNCNIWRNVWVYSANSTAAAAFYLESTANANWLYDNVFEDITGESNPGGLIEAYSVHGLTIRRCYSWDASVPYARDIIKVGKSTATGALASRHILIEHGVRHGGSLTGGVYDINLVPADVNTSRVFNIGHSTGSATLNLPADTIQTHVVGFGNALPTLAGATSVAGLLTASSGLTLGTTADANQAHRLGVNANCTVVRGGTGHKVRVFPSGSNGFGELSIERGVAGTGENTRLTFMDTAQNMTPNLYGDAANVLATDSHLAIKTAGRGLQVKEGSNAKAGVATLVAGTVTVATTAVTATSRIQLTGNSDGGTPGWLRVSTRTAGTSFVITSSSGTDTSTVAWLIVDPA